MNGQNRAYQTFTAARAHYLNYVSLRLYKVGNPVYTATIGLYNVDANHQPTGMPLCSTTFAASGLTTAAAWRNYRFNTGCLLSEGTEYAIVLSGTTSTSSTMMVAISATGGYDAGECGFSSGGGAWQALAGEDIAFKEGQDPWCAQYTTHITARAVGGLNQAVQTVTPSSSHYFEYASFCFYRIGSPAYNVTIALYRADASHQPTGAQLCSATFNAASLSGSNSWATATWYEYRLRTGYLVSANTEYAIVLSGDGGGTGNTVMVRMNWAGRYTGGRFGTSINGGSSWVMSATSDMAFREGGPP